MGIVPGPQQNCYLMPLNLILLIPLVKLCCSTGCSKIAFFLLHGNPSLSWISLHEIFFLDAIQQSVPAVQVYNNQLLLYTCTTVSSCCTSVQQSAPAVQLYNSQLLLYNFTTVSSWCTRVHKSAPAVQEYNSQLPLCKCSTVSSYWRGGPLSERIFYYK